MNEISAMAHFFLFFADVLQVNVYKNSKTSYNEYSK